MDNFTQEAPLLFGVCFDKNKYETMQKKIEKIVTSKKWLVRMAQTKTSWLPTNIRQRNQKLFVLFHKIIGRNRINWVYKNLFGHAVEANLR